LKENRFCKSAAESIVLCALFYYCNNNASKRSGGIKTAIFRRHRFLLYIWHYVRASCWNQAHVQVLV